MSYAATDLDSIVNYQNEYLAVIQKPQITGSRLTGLCPFHQDKNASFSADLTSGKYHCFACNAEGNFLTFWSNLYSVDTHEAYKQILEKYHIEPVNATYKVEDYATKKHIPAEWLRQEWGLSDSKEKDGTPSIKIPYINENGKQVLYRKRLPEGSKSRFKWQYGSAGKIIPYGEKYLNEYRENEKYVVIVEGESDTHTLRYLGFPVLGVPGASNFKTEWCSKLRGIDTVYLHIEPDNGGQTFLAQMTQKLRDGGYTGHVFKWSCGAYAVKDPSELFIKHGDTARTEVQDALNEAKAINLNALEDEIPAAVEGAPIRLRQPEGWIYSEKGISMIDEKTTQPTLVCRTPILITKRLKSTETGDEKIELAFKRDGAWHTTVQARSTVFQSKSVTVLADLGCTVTSENAKYVVRFLEKLEAENLDIIEKVDSASTFGWLSSDTFLPGLAPNVVLDIEPSLRGWASAYCQNGTFEDWIDMIAPHRQRDKFRFILAAAFTAPLLRIIHQRIFFVYNWGGSKGGKSAALKAALSVWGDPERLMVNFNATQVALERMAGFYCDLPLGIDERQLAGNNQGALEKIVYMLASGTGRVRGSKTGGLQTLQTWRTVILATGEEPITTETSQTGVSTRVLEIYGPPFDDEKSAGLMHQSSGDNCGWAGIEYIKRLIALGEEEIRDRYNTMLEYVYDRSEGKNSSHVSGIAAVATSDALVDEWFFGNNRADAEERARKMADTIIRGNEENAARDVNESATEFVADWIMSNIKSFNGDGYGQQLGWIKNDFAYVYPALLNKALSDAKFSPRKTLKYLAEQEIIDTSFGNGRTRFAVRASNNGIKAWMVKIDLREIETENPDGRCPLPVSTSGKNCGHPENSDEFADLDEDANLTCPF